VDEAAERLNAVNLKYRFILLLLATLCLYACDWQGGGAGAIPQRDAAAPPTQTPSPPAPRFVNKVWKTQSPPDRAPGSIYIFLPDGTLLMTSCVETYRLATWRLEADGRLTVSEDQATTNQAEILELGERDLRLRLHLAKDKKVELGLQVAETPFVCPDLRR
jgi:hypothetical protein